MLGLNLVDALDRLFLEDVSGGSDCLPPEQAESLQSPSKIWINGHKTLSDCKFVMSAKDAFYTNFSEMISTGF